jgi:hypothetical protein
MVNKYIDPEQVRTGRRRFTRAFLSQQAPSHASGAIDQRYAWAEDLKGEPLAPATETEILEEALNMGYDNFIDTMLEYRLPKKNRMYWVDEAFNAYRNAARAEAKALKLSLKGTSWE